MSRPSADWRAVSADTNETQKKRVGSKRPENCFRCWHCRRVEGVAKCCVCFVNHTKHNPPELILEPYRGKCPSFYDKHIEEERFEHEGISEYTKGMWD